MPARALFWREWKVMPPHTQPWRGSICSVNGARLVPWHISTPILGTNAPRKRPSETLCQSCARGGSTTRRTVGASAHGKSEGPRHCPQVVSFYTPVGNVSGPRFCRQKGCYLISSRGSSLTSTSAFSSITQPSWPWSFLTLNHHSIPSASWVLPGAVSQGCSSSKL